jgi:hypothetical protein
MSDANVFSARRHTLRGARAAAAAWQELHRDATRALGDRHPLSLRIECDLAALLVEVRPVAASIAACTDLRARADLALPAQHPSAMAIRALAIRCLARRGEPGDLDRVVALAQRELGDRLDAEVGDVWIGLARIDLALAMVERVRFGRFDQLRRDLDITTGLDDGFAELQQARQLVDAEVGQRADRYGPGGGHTWQARAVQADVLLAQARLETPGRAGELTALALTIADGLLAREWHRYRAHTPGALRGQLLRVRALTAAGRRREAEGEARLAAVLARRYDPVPRAEALVAQARATAPRDRRGAASAATRAVALRRSLLPGNNHQVVEARELLETLARDPDEPPGAWRRWSATFAESLECLEVDDRDLAVAGTNEP